MRKLSEADLKAIADAPVFFFLFDIAAPGLPEPVRVAQTDIISNGVRYAGIPLGFEPNLDGDTLTVRGDYFAPLAQFLPVIDRAPVTISVIMENAPDDVLATYQATFCLRRPNDDDDVVGYLRLAPETQKAPATPEGSGRSSDNR